MGRRWSVGGNRQLRPDSFTLQFKKSELTPGLCPEAKWLLAIAAVNDPAVRTGRLRALNAGGLDASLMLALAARHRLQSHILRALEQFPADIAPPGFAKALHTAARTETMHTLHLSRELLAIVTLLEAERIPVLAFKGPVLAAALYGGLAARHSWDLDVLVRHEDLERVRRLMHARGYVPEPLPASKAEQELLARDCECNLDHPRLGIHLEIHWELFDEENRRGLDAEFAWQSTMRVEIGGGSVQAPAPAEMFVALSAHGGEKHRWERLKWVVDIAHFPIAFPGIDWSAVLALAESVGRRQVALEGIYLAVKLLGAPFPPAIASEAERDSRAAAYAALARGRLFRADGDFPGFAEWLAYLHAARAPALRDGVFARARTLCLYLRTVLAPEWADRRRHRIPQQLAFLRYIMRLKWLVHTYRAGLAARLK